MIDAASSPQATRDGKGSRTSKPEIVGEKSKEFYTPGGKKRKKNEKTLGQLHKEIGEIEEESNLTEDESKCVRMEQDIMQSLTCRQSRV